MHRARWSFWLLLLAFAPVVCAGPADDQYRVAAHHYRNARWQLAVAEFETFIERFGDDARADDARFYLAEALVQEHHFDRARTAYSDYLKRAPDGAHAGQALFRRGELAYLQKNYAAAQPDLEQFHKKYPDNALNVHALYYLGEIALEAADAESARAWYQQCLKLRPEGAVGDDCRFGLAQALELAGDVDGALRFYRFLADKPHCALSDQAQLQVAIILYHEGRFEDAIKTVKRWLDKSPGEQFEAHARYWLGMSQLASGQWRPATKTLLAAAQRFPEHELAPAMQFAGAEALRKSGDTIAARRRYEELVKRWPKSRWADDAAQILVQLAWDEQRLDDVQHLAEKFQKTYPESQLRWIVQQTLGRALIKQGDFAAAQRVFEQLTRAADLDKSQASGARPDDGRDGGKTPDAPADAVGDEALAARSAPANWYYLALAQLGNQKFNAALEALDRVKQVKEPVALANGILVARAAALVGLERYRAAITPLEKYLAAAPDGVDATKCRAQLAVAYAKTGRWSDARRTVSKMDDSGPAQSIYLQTVQYLAEAAYEQKHLDVAAAMFRRLTRDGVPRDYMARGFSGLAWLAWDKDPGSPKAAAAFAKLLARFPHHKLAAEAAMMRGRALEKQGRLDGALAMYHLVFEEFPEAADAPAAALAAGKVHDRLGQDRDAETVLRRLMKEHPDYHPDAVLYQLAWVLVDEKRQDEADRLFQQLHDTMPDSDYWADATYRLAERAARAKQIRRADHLAAELLKSDNGKQMMPYALYLRGQIAATEQRWKDVLHWMRQLVDAYPASPLVAPARYWLAEAHYRLQQFAESRRLFDQLAADKTMRHQPWMAMVALRRAQVRAQQHQWDDAYAIASGIAKQYPKFDRQYEVDYVLGRYYASRAEFDRARNAYRRVVESPTGAHTETAAMAQWMIGETYFLQKQYDQAIKAYYRVEGLYDYPRWQAAALLQAGKCHEMAGRWSDAISVYTQITHEYAQTEVAKKARNRLRVARQRAEIAKRR